MSTHPSPSLVERGRLDYIDVLRGGACLWVLLYHALGSYHEQPGLSHLPMACLLGLARMGWLGVNLFLVLSGFCLYYPLVRRTTPAAVRLDLRTFAVRRAWRILPPYYVALLLYSCLLVIQQHRHGLLEGNGFAGWWDVPVHLIMLHNLLPSTMGTINGAFWSLALESQLYLVFPVLIMMAARRGFGFLLGLTLALAVAWQLMVFHYLGLSHYWTQSGTWYYALPGKCFEFAVGMAAAYLAVNLRPGMIKRLSAIVGLLLLPAICFTAQVSRFCPPQDQLWGIIFGCTLVVLNRVPSRYFQTYRVLRAMTWTGTISYSLYLMHELVFAVLGPGGHSDLTLVLWAAMEITVAIALSYLFFLWVERPFLTRNKNHSADATRVALSPAP